MPMIVITTKSSTNVNALRRFDGYMMAFLKLDVRVAGRRLSGCRPNHVGLSQAATRLKWLANSRPYI
jgi:hypothetical protein